MMLQLARVLVSFVAPTNVPHGGYRDSILHALAMMSRPNRIHSSLAALIHRSQPKLEVLESASAMTSQMMWRTRLIMWGCTAINRWVACDRVPTSALATRRTCLGSPSPQLAAMLVSVMPSLTSQDAHVPLDFSPGVTCPSHKPIAIPRTSWLWLILLTLSIFSTVFSGIYLAIAIRGPRYGRLIHQDRAFSISTASVLFTVFAKLIELSFVTVFVAFLGQVISRRAFMRKHGKGITLACHTSMARYSTG